MRILIIDDDATTVEMLELALKLEGHEVATASDGRQGIARCLEMTPDAVVLDVMMPDMSGFDVLRSLRSDPRSAELPVVLLSARGEDTAVWEGWMSGADAYITKPMDIIDLTSELERLTVDRSQS